jgi:hypothetical protein
MTSAPSEPDDQTVPAADNLLDDIFGSSPPRETSHIQATTTVNSQSTTNTHPATNVEPSDLPSLRRQHITAGYRDGVSTSKTEHVQEGFDAGYSVGAQFGLRAGTVLGILEGILNGLDTRASSGPVKKRVSTAASANGTETEEEKGIGLQNFEKIRQLYKTALSELGVQALFGGLVATDGPPGEGQEERPEKRLADKAGPIVSNWEKLASVTKWEESMEAVEDMEDHDHDDTKASPR